MIRRPLWNRGSGVFVEEAAWSESLERRPAADMAPPGQPAPAVHTAPAADRARKTAPAKTAERRRAARPANAPATDRERLEARRPWLGVVTVREED